MAFFALSFALQSGVVRADDASIADAASADLPHVASNPVGLGLMNSDEGDEHTEAIVLEGANHFKQRMTAYGVRQYGFAQSRAELGNHVGVSFAALSGITLIGLDNNDQTLSPHFGVEPFSLQVTWNTSAVRQSFYDWFPMASLGPQVSVASCRVMALGRAGGAVGNLGKAGFWPDARPAYGGAALLNCSRFDLGIELTRIDRAEPIELAALDLGIPFGTRGNWKIGMRAETLSYGAEHRVMAVFRGNPFDAL